MQILLIDLLNRILHVEYWTRDLDWKMEGEVYTIEKQAPNEENKPCRLLQKK